MEDAAGTAPQNADEKRLAELGYKQELKRGLNMLTNFGISFCVLSFPTGVVGSFATAWFWGGPVTAVWGWIIVSLMICGTVGLALSEICSSYPTSGGLYFWSAKLGGRHGVFASWIAGWFNLLGQAAVTSAVGMACTMAIVVLIVIATCPTRLNRHGGMALNTFTSVNAGGLSYLAPDVPRLEPCPVDFMHNLVTSDVAYLDPILQVAVYRDPTLAGRLAAYVTDVYGSNHTSIAYDDAECRRQPFNPTQPRIYGIFCAVLFAYACINCMSIGVMNTLLQLSIFFHIFGSLIIIIGLPAAAQSHLPAATIWTRFQPGNWGATYGNGAPPGKTIFMGYMANDNMNFGGNGISATDHDHAGQGAFPESLVTDSTAATYHTNWLHEKTSHEASGLSPANPYIFFCGMLMSQWSFTGYDASAHMVEETTNAAVAGPQGIIRALTINAAFGLAFIIAIIASVPDYMNSFFGPLSLNYNPVAQIMFDVMEQHYGNGRYACGFWIIIVVCMFLCGVSCLTSNSRMLYAFARDGACPGSKLWHTISPRLGIPVNAVCAMACAAVLIALPAVYSTTAYAAVTSITTIGLYISYIIPMICRLTVGKNDFVPGPFYLGDRLSIFVHSAAVCWVILICVIFVLPNTYPINMELNFNYAIIAVGIVLAYALGTWFLPGPKPFNAREWFKGPNITALAFDAVPDGGPGASVRGGKGYEVPLGV